MPELFLMDLVKNSCCPTQVLEIMNCTWNPDTGTLTTHQEASEDDNCLVLETALWFHDVFAKLGAYAKGKPRRQALPLETLFNLDEDRFVKTVHHCHDQAAATTVGSTPSRKGKSKIVNVTALDEDSASLSCIDRPCIAAAVGDKASSPSRGEDDGKALGAANGR
jgi:hypothetical protein